MKIQRYVWQLGLVAAIAGCGGPPAPWAKPAPLTAQHRQLVLALGPEVVLTGPAANEIKKHLPAYRDHLWSATRKSLGAVGFRVNDDGRVEPDLTGHLTIAVSATAPGLYSAKVELQWTAQEPVETLTVEVDGDAEDLPGEAGRRLANLATRSSVLAGRARTVAETRTPSPPLTDVQLVPEGGADRRLLFLPLRPLDGVPGHLAPIVTHMLLVELDGVRGLSLLGTDDVSAMIEAERAQDLLGCDEVRCYAEIGGVMGVDWVLHGDLGRIGSSYNLGLTVIESRTGSVVARTAPLVPANEDTLARSIKPVARELAEKLAASVSR